MRICSEENIRLMVYCPMDNHVQLLIQAENALSRSMHSFFKSFSHYYNEKAAEMIGRDYTLKSLNDIRRMDKKV